MAAVWLPIPGASDYEISDDGQARSVDRFRTHVYGGRQKRRGVVLKPRTHHGYHWVTITLDTGRRRTVSIHSQMCRTFHGPPPTPKHEARHLNGIKLDNRPDNLAWGTKSQNALDSVRHGQHAEARKTRCPKGHNYTAVQYASGRRRVCRECKKR